jgi:hypothetical protein
LAAVDDALSESMKRTAIDANVRLRTAASFVALFGVCALFMWLNRCWFVVESIVIVRCRCFSIRQTKYNNGEQKTQ